MKMKTISKLLATSVFALTASASQAADWELLDVTMKWDTQATYDGFFDPSVPVAASKLDKYRNSQAIQVSDYVVQFGYWGNKAKKPADYTINPKDDEYSVSALVIEDQGKLMQRGYVLKNTDYSNDANRIKFYNNYLEEFFRVPGYLTVDVAFDVLGVSDSIESSFQIYYERQGVKYYTTKAKFGQVKNVEDGGGYLYINAATLVEGDFSFDFALTDANGKDYALTTNCGKSGFDTCYKVGDLIKLGKGKESSSVMDFHWQMTAVPEPETYAMLLAGLGLVGIVSRRRRSAI